MSMILMTAAEAERAEWLAMLRQPRITGKRLTVDSALWRHGVQFTLAGEEADDGTPFRQAVLPEGGDVFCLDDDAEDGALVLAFVFADGAVLTAVERWVEDGVCGHHELRVVNAQTLAVRPLRVLVDLLATLVN